MENVYLQPEEFREHENLSISMGDLSREPGCKRTPITSKKKKELMFV